MMFGRGMTVGGENLVGNEYEVSGAQLLCLTFVPNLQTLHHIHG